jgi:hypothetical protein
MDKELEQARKRIAELSAELEEHNHRYYVLAEPVISDRQFDLLLEELAGLEKQWPAFASPNSPTQRVGGDISKNFNTVTHRYPMLSLEQFVQQGRGRRIRGACGEGDRDHHLRDGIEIRRSSHQPHLREWRTGPRSNTR